LFAKFYAGLADGGRIYCPLTRQLQRVDSMEVHVVSYFRRACSHIYWKGQEKKINCVAVLQARKSFFFI